MSALHPNRLPAVLRKLRTNGCSKYEFLSIPFTVCLVILDGPEPVKSVYAQMVAHEWLTSMVRYLRPVRHAALCFQSTDKAAIAKL